MKVTVIKKLTDKQKDDRTSSDQHDWLKEAEQHPTIKKYRPVSIDSTEYLALMHPSKLCCWVTQVSQGYWRWMMPRFKIDRRFKTI